MTNNDREEVLKVYPDATFCVHWHYGVRTAGIVADGVTPDSDDICLADQVITDAPANEEELWKVAASRLPILAAAQKIAAYEFHEQCHVQEIGRRMQQVFDLRNDLAAKDARIAELGQKIKVVPDGPPCPSCGFKITTSVRPPFEYPDE